MTEISHNTQSACPQGANRSMTGLDIPAGTRLLVAGCYYRVDSDSNSSRLRITDIHTGDVRYTDAEGLNTAISRGEVTVVAPDFQVPTVQMQYRPAGHLDSLIEQIPVSLRSPVAIKVMLTKIDWIKRLKAHNVVNFLPSLELEMKLKELEQRYGEKCPFEMWTLYKAALKLKKSQGDAKAIYPRFDRRGGAGQSRLDPEVDQIVDSVFTRMTEPGSEWLTASGAYDRIVRAVRQANVGRAGDEKLKEPSLPTVSRRFKKHFSAFDVAVRKYGKERAERMFRSSGVRIRAERALDIVMYDDTDTCVFLTDDATGLPWGRCWLTTGVDEFTKSITGFSMSEAHRSTVSALGAIVHALAPKDHTHEDFALCQGRWHAYGNQGLIVLDNASYNHSHELQAALVDLNIEFEFSRPHHPTDKTCSEYSHHRTKQEFCSQLPGWSGPKEDRELLDKGISTAVMSLREFRQAYVRWVVDEYSNTYMEDGYTPRQLWEQCFRDHAPFMPQRMPSNELLGTIPKTLKFRDSGGILRKKLRYQSPELDLIRRQIGETAEVSLRYHPHDLSFIYVHDPRTGNYLKVPCVENSRIFKGITDWQWSLILKRARALKNKKGEDVTLEHAMEAREKLREETAQLRTSKRMRERKRAYQMNFSSSGEVEADAPKTQKKQKQQKFEEIATSPLEDLVIAIEEDYPEESEEMTAIYF